jgi:hypothetical protein
MKTLKRTLQGITVSARASEIIGTSVRFVPHRTLRDSTPLIDQARRHRYEVISRTLLGTPQRTAPPWVVPPDFGAGIGAQASGTAPEKIPSDRNPSL